MIRNIITIAAIVFLISTMYASSGFAQGTFGMSVSGQATAKQLDRLRAKGLNPDQLSDIQRLAASAAGKVEASFDKKMKTPGFVKADMPFPLGITQPEEQGYHFLEQYKGLYRIKTPRQELKVKRSIENRYSQKIVRYQQYYKGIKVVGAEVIVRINPGNKLWNVQGKYIPDINIPTKPTFKKSLIKQVIAADFAVRRGPETYRISTPELGILNNWLYDPSFDNKSMLVWEVLLTEDVTGREWTYHIDAQDGSLLDVLDSARYHGSVSSQAHDRQDTVGTGDDEIWYINDVLQTIPGGTLDPETTDMNTATTQFWNYLHTTFTTGSWPIHSIDSDINSPGMQLIGSAYYLDPDDIDADLTNDFCPNACWNCIGGQAVFCNGMVTRDIVVHEFAHGLVQETGGGLNYLNQSGALNESFADVFGEFVDCSVGVCDWLHGFSRDMSNPLNRGQQPDHFGDDGNPATDHPRYTPPCADPDVCGTGGVHTNSGIPNLVAYLIVNGTRPNDPSYKRHHYNFNIPGIGLAKTEQLYYDTLAVQLGWNATFAFARNNMVDVCDNYVSSGGIHGFTGADCASVRNAWASVGIDGLSGPHQVLSGNLDSFPEPAYIQGVGTAIPWHVTGDTAISVGRTVNVSPLVYIYFFPNTKITANGLLDANGLGGDIKFLSSRDDGGAVISHDFKLQNGGEFKMPISTFVSSDTTPTAIGLRDPGEVSSFIRIDRGFVVTDVNVMLNIAHTNVSHLKVSLESPAGINVDLFQVIPAGGVNFTDTILDDEATTLITDGTAPYAGSFQPQNSLAAFDGENSTGYWTLKVQDFWSPSTGELQSWSITFNE